MRPVIQIAIFILAVAAMIYILSSNISIPYDYGLPLAVFSIFAIILFSAIGLFERTILKYAIISTIIQFAYFLLDVSTAVLIKKSVLFAVVQLINFTIAGALFTVVISLLYIKMKKEKIIEYAGLYDKNQFIVLALCIACLSLGGIPGFNIFVGEFLIYISLFTIHPALTVLAIFAGLICFLFYFRICYTLFAGKKEIVITRSMISKLLIGILALLVIILGVIPQILFTILEAFI